MSITVQDPPDDDTGAPLDAGSELACDEVLFGPSQGTSRELESTREETALLREQLSLIASGLALREVRTREPLPPALRSAVQAQAFQFFERRGAASPPTATTTGANVVELASPMPPPTRRRAVWGLLAAAACFTVVGLSLRKFTDGGAQARSAATTATPPLEASTTAAGPSLRDPLSASKAGVSAELTSTGDQLLFSWRSPANVQLPADTALWLRLTRAGAPRWERMATLAPNPAGVYQLQLDARALGTVLGFAVAVPTPQDPSLPDLERAQLEASVSP